MRRRLVPLALFLLFSGPLRSQEAIDPIEVRCIPPRYYVGDTVTMKIKFRTNDFLSLRTPVYPRDEKIEVSSIEITRSSATEAEASVAFRSFVPGPKSVSLDFGSVALKPIALYVDSLTEEGGAGEPKGLLGPVQLAGTRSWLAGLVAAVIVLPAAVIFSITLVKRLVGWIRAVTVSPRRKFIKALAKLRREEGLPDTGFYRRLTASFRDYLANRTNLPEFRSATEERLLSLLMICYKEEEALDAAALFARVDMIRFGGEESVKDERQRFFSTILHLAKELK